MAGNPRAALEALRKVPLFALFSDQDLERVIPILHDRRVEKGRVIFNQGGELDTVYVIFSGRVKVVMVTEDGLEQVMNILSAGDIFPHVGLLEGGSYPATALALEDTHLAGLRRSDLLALVRHHGDLAVQLLMMLGETIRTLQDRIRDLSLRSLQGRLAATLWRLAKQGQAGPGLPVTIGLTHQELSSLVGASRESVSRALSALRREGVVETGAGELRLPDPDRLLDHL
ncbi:MAG: Crp/Fnr family transcriptional regulator [Bacillota bacterium]